MQHQPHLITVLWCCRGVKKGFTGFGSHAGLTLSVDGDGDGYAMVQTRELLNTDPHGRCWG